MKTLGIFLSIAFLGGCQNGNSPLMRPGADCLVCHTGDDAPKWNVAGTVYGAPNAAATAGIQGVTVHVTDTNGRKLDLTTNSAGNFYTAEDMQPPFTVALEKDGAKIASTSSQPSGACNSCHGSVPLNGAAGRLYWSAN